MILHPAISKKMRFGVGLDAAIRAFMDPTSCVVDFVLEHAVPPSIENDAKLNQYRLRMKKNG